MDSSPDKRVICPESWFEILYRANDIKDLYPEEWSKLRIRKSYFRMDRLYMYAISHYRYVYYKNKKLIASYSYENRDIIYLYGTLLYLLGRNFIRVLKSLLCRGSPCIP